MRCFQSKESPSSAFPFSLRRFIKETKNSWKYLVVIASALIFPQECFLPLDRQVRQEKQDRRRKQEGSEKVACSRVFNAAVFCVDQQRSGWWWRWWYYMGRCILPSFSLLSCRATHSFVKCTINQDTLPYFTKWYACTLPQNFVCEPCPDFWKILQAFAHADSLTHRRFALLQFFFLLNLFCSFTHQIHTFSTLHSHLLPF